MVIKIWHKFFLLALLSFMPLVSQAQNCITPSGYTQQGAVTTLPMPDGIQVIIRLRFTIQSANCIAMPNQISPAGIQSGSPQTFSQNGLTVNINDTKLKLRTSLSCVVSGLNSNTMVFSSCTGQPDAVIDMVYTVKGKSTTTASNIKLFDMLLTTFPTAGSSSGSFSSAATPFNVPASTAPTCNFQIDPQNITLASIKLSDIQNLATGAVVTSGQKTFNLNVTCQNNALKDPITFIPQFSPIKSAVLTGNSHVALNDGTDNGVGFTLFDSSGSPLPYKTPLSAFPNSKFSLSSSVLTGTRTFNIKYAKTSQAVTSGPVTSSITVTFSLP